MKTLQRSFLNSLNMNIKTVLDVDVLSAALNGSHFTQFDGSMLKYQLKFNLQFILILFFIDNFFKFNQRLTWNC